MKGGGDVNWGGGTVNSCGGRSPPGGPTVHSSATVASPPLALSVRRQWPPEPQILMNSPTEATTRSLFNIVCFYVTVTVT